MSKTQIYYQHCVDAAHRSSMAFHLGAVLVKGGKILSTGYNHHRPHYDGRDAANRKPVSMHAEMHAIYNACGSFSPTFKMQLQGSIQTYVTRPKVPPPLGTPQSRTGSESDSGCAGAREYQWEQQQQEEQGWEETIEEFEYEHEREAEEWRREECIEPPSDHM